MKKCCGTRERSSARHLSGSSVCMKEKTRKPTRSSANWNWTMRQKEGSSLSILTQSRCVCVHVCINACYGDRMLKLHVTLFLFFFSECRVSGGGQHPFTRYAPCPVQHPHSGHPPSRGSASLHTEKGHLLWVGILLFPLTDLHVNVLHIYSAAEDL